MHRPSPIRSIAFALLAAGLTFGAVACSEDDDSSSSPTTADASAPDAGGTDSPDGSTGDGSELEKLAGKRIGVQSDTTGEDYAQENAPEGAEVVSFDDTVGLFGALESGDIEAILQDIPVNAYRTTQDDSVEVVETYETGEQYGFAMKKGNELKGEVDDALAQLREDGSYDAIYDKWFPEDGNAGPGLDPSDVDGSDTLKVCSDVPYAPMEMEGDGPRGLDYTGFDIELLDAIAVILDANLEIKAVGFDGILGNLESGECDIVASSMTITEARAEEADFSEPYFDAHQSLLVKK